MKPYFRKYELLAYLDMKNTTLAHWIKYFNEFIPICRQGDVQCYGLEAKAVLMRIKTLRERLYSLPHIREIIMNEGYPKFKNPVN